MNAPLVTDSQETVTQRRLENECDSEKIYGRTITKKATLSEHTLATSTVEYIHVSTC